jgi:dienelactone hydrolase
VSKSPRQRRGRAIFAIMLMCISAARASAEATAAPAAPKVATFAARDTLHIAPAASADARQMLDALAWTPRDFTVVCVHSDVGGGQDALVMFDSPGTQHPGTGKAADRVVLEWYAARDPSGKAIRAPAALVIHTIHPDMPIGRLIARNLAARGIHAFMMQLPGYGLRRDNAEHPWDAHHFIARLHQGIGDARRARDAIAALPNLDGQPVTLVGVSMGGIVAATAAGLDGAAPATPPLPGDVDPAPSAPFAAIALLMTGGDVARILREGQADAAWVRDDFARIGLTGVALDQAVDAIEPLRLADRIPSKNTWLFSARQDQVIPPACAVALAARIGLDAAHHVAFDANHYTSVLQLPALINRVADLAHLGRARLTGSQDRQD